MGKNLCLRKNLKKNYRNYLSLYGYCDCYYYLNGYEYEDYLYYDLVLNYFYFCGDDVYFDILDYYYCYNKNHHPQYYLYYFDLDYLCLFCLFCLYYYNYCYNYCGSYYDNYCYNCYYNHC